nr:hypothetical protein [Tanacetum cinerariifolium]
MIQGVDSEFNFLPKGGLDKNQSSTKSVNNEAPGGLSSIGPDAPSYLEEGKRLTVAGKRKVDGKRKIAMGSHGEGLHRKARKVPAQASKVVGDASSPLDVDSDPDIHEFPSAKELKDTTDCQWVVAHETPHSWHPAILCGKKRLRKIKHIHSWRKSVNGLHSEYSRLILEEKKWINYEQALFTLRAKVKGLRSKGKRLKAFEIWLLQEVDSLRLVKASIIYGRCIAFEEVAELKKPFVLEEMPGYHPSSKKEYD